MRRLAGSVAAAGFFALAAVGAASGVPPFVCAWRALLGAAALYVVATVAGRVVVETIAQDLTRRTPHPPNLKDTARERGNP
jgi:hypothetical protein